MRRIPHVWNKKIAVKTGTITEMLIIIQCSNAKTDNQQIYEMKAFHVSNHSNYVSALTH